MADISKKQIIEILKLEDVWSGVAKGQQKLLEAYSENVEAGLLDPSEFERMKGMVDIYSQDSLQDLYIDTIVQNVQKNLTKAQWNKWVEFNKTNDILSKIIDDSANVVFEVADREIDSQGSAKH